MSELYRIKHLQTALAHGTIILTPNRRIAEKIKQAWGYANTGKVIAAPHVYSANDWLNTLVLTQEHQTKILNDIECSLLWELVVNNIDHGLLMPAAAIAELVSSADDLLQQWCIDYGQLPNDPDSKLLKKCIVNFEKECIKQGWISSYRHHKNIAKAFTNKQITAPDTLVLTGFDDITPLFKKILIASGSTVITADATGIKTNVQTVSLANTTQEFYAAATWAQEQFRKNRQANKKDISVGVIVPNLHYHRQEIERIFQSVFEPQYINPQIPRYSPPFNISASESLASQPIIAAAMQLLKLTNRNMLFNELLSILHSPFWSNYQDEMNERINAELQLRKSRWEKLGAINFRDALSKNSPIINRLNDFENEKRKIKSDLYPSEWLGYLQRQLSILGWPGTRRLDSVEYQQVAQFQNILDQFISMDDILGKINFQQAFQYLQNLCKKTLYHAQTQDSPIQILGLLEGSSLHFDAVWICSMSEQHWPPLPKPHALLPLVLQTTYNMPHCSTEREELYCNNITRDLLNSAKTIVVSFAEQVDDSKQRISHYFSQYKQVNINEILNTPLIEQHPYLLYITRQQQWMKVWELVKDAQGPVFTHTKARGGQGLLKMQAQNPFDAFATYRLNAKPLEEPVSGLPKSERGVLIHAALYHFWKNCQQNGTAGLAALLQCTDEKKITLIEDSVEFAFRRVSHPALFNETFRAIEKIQLSKHLYRWLIQEEQRLPFKVLALEKNITYVLNDIELSLTIDRIDELSDGSFLLIDYKTTSAALTQKQWLDQRPEEPQLPLYCLANNNCSGICFAQINLSTMRFVAMGSHPDIPSLTEKKLSTSIAWQEQQQQWQQQLQCLIQEFKNGVASVDYCHGKIPEHSKTLHILNRWPEKEFIDELLIQEVTP